jgi:hypothetical protein
VVEAALPTQRTRPNPVVGWPAKRSRNRTFNSGRRLCARRGRSGAPKRSPKADVRPSVAVAAQMSAAGGKASVRVSSPGPMTW